VGQAATRLLQQRGAFVAVGLAANGLSPLTPEAALGRDLERNPPSFDPTALVSKQPPLLLVASRAESNRQEHIRT
jgi:hypothetical protein